MLSAHASDHPSLEAVLNGTPVPFRHAMRYTTGGQTHHVTLSTHPLTCAGVAGGRVLAPDEITLSLVIANRLAPDGSTSWQVATLNHDNLNLYDVGPVDIVERSPGTVGFSLDLSGDEALGSRRLQYVLRGSIQAHDCGVVYRSQTATVPQPALTVQIAGEAVSILGATLVGPREHLELRLSDVPHGCADSTSGADVALTVRLGGAPLSATSVRLSGNRFASPQIANLGPMFRETLDVKAISDSQLETDGPISVVLDGAFTAGAYPVRLQGAVTAQRCR